MDDIKVEKATDQKLKNLNVKNWSPWDCEPSIFDWEYDEKETCFIMQGKARVTSGNQEVEFGKGDIVVFPKGLKCKWQVIDKISKVYKFG